jgi:hypothetical protein
LPYTYSQENLSKAILISKDVTKTFLC